MEIAVKTLFLGLNHKLARHKHEVPVFSPNLTSNTASFPHKIRYRNEGFTGRENHKYFPHACAVLAGAEDVAVSSSEFDGFFIKSSSTDKNGKLKISVEVSGATTREIFDKVFDKMVEAAQPIPGFRRVKGGKTPNIPRHVLLEVLGPTNVYKQVIKKVVNTTIAEYVEKEGLKVSKDLKVEQSFEDLEDAFEPDENFSFDAVVQLQQTN